MKRTKAKQPPRWDVRRLRYRLTMTCNEMAKELGVSRSFVTELENGWYSPRTDWPKLEAKLVDLAKRHGVKWKPNPEAKYPGPPPERSQEAKSAKLKAAAARRKEGGEAVIEVNGCRLVKGKEDERCARIEGGGWCEDYGVCLDKVARADWVGWRCVGGDK